MSQALFSTILHTRRAQRALAEDGESSALAHSLGTIAELTRDAQSEMRALIAQLGRDPLDGGLVAALSRLTAETSERDGIAVRLAAPEHDPPLPGGAQAHLFAIAREALANAVKHGGVDAVDVRLRSSLGNVVLEVTDGGGGFDPMPLRPGHFGLDSMRSRAAEIGGRLTISSSSGHGTVVRVVVPIGDDPP